MSRRNLSRTNDIRLIIPIRKGEPFREASRLDWDDLLDLKHVAPQVVAMAGLIGRKADQIDNFGDRVVVVWLGKDVGSDLLPASENLADILVRVREDLRKNATSVMRRPLKEVVHSKRAAEVLKTSHRHSDSEAPSYLEVGEEAFPIPAVDADWLADVASPKDVCRLVDWLVTAVRRVPGREIELELTKDGVVVLIPADHALADWSCIRDVLEIPTKLVGTIIREAKRTPWRLGDEAKLVPQKDLFGV